MTKRSAFTVAVWVWSDKYGGLHAGWEQPTRGQQARQVHLPLPNGREYLQRLYGKVTADIAILKRVAKETGSLEGSITRRPAFCVRAWEEDGVLHAGLRRRKGAVVHHFPFPADLDFLRELLAGVTDTMEARHIPQQRWIKKSGPSVITVTAAPNPYPEAGRRGVILSGLPTLGKRR